VEGVCEGVGGGVTLEPPPPPAPPTPAATFQLVRDTVGELPPRMVEGVGWVEVSELGEGGEEGL